VSPSTMSEDRVILDEAGLEASLRDIAEQIAAQDGGGAEVVLVGIARGGVPLAQRLGRLLAGRWGHAVPVGSVDIGMHRDDLSHRAAPNIHPTVIPCDITGRTVVLVDDVLFSGRSVRAALDALNDFGRPRRVQLATLIDRGHRELPIRADFVGRTLETARQEVVRVRLREDDGVDEVRVSER
jgi:pyrimidine operon attenuation protein / uracil phosphoribosyltransferase